jgi:thiol-disulfide isomerase/thioredoxin
MKTIILLLSLIFNMQVFAAADNFTTIDGKTISQGQIQGKWLILQYWANWCDICMGEMPELQFLYNHLDKSKANMYLVNFDGLNKKQLQKIFSQNQINIPSLKGNPAAQYGVHGLNALPVMVVINPKGQVHKVLYGPQSSQTIIKIINK